VTEAVWCSSAAVTSALVAAWVLGLGEGTWRRPLDLANDANLNALLVKRVVEGGWALSNPDLGAPLGQHLHDFPFADNLSLLLVRVIAVFTSDWALALNVFFVGTFPLVALGAYGAARRLRVGPPAAAAAGVVYALAPYHFARGEQHLFLSNYLAVPLGLALVLTVLEDTALVRWEGARLGGWATPQTGFTVVTVLLLGASVQYYPLFVVGLLAATAVLRVVAARSVRAGAQGIVTAAALVGWFLLNLAPNLLYRIRNGANDAVATRTLGETAAFSFEPIDLFLPVHGHRLGLFRDLSARVIGAFGTPPEFGATSLGLLGAVGLLSLLAVAAVALHDRERVEPTDRHLALLTIACLLLGARGGLTALLAATVGSPLRAWNRFSILIAFLALVLLARQATRGIDRLGRGWRTVAAAGLALVTLLAVLDQTSPSLRPPHAANAVTWSSDAAFVARIEQELPPGAAVLQLPYLPFPEHGPLRAMADYDPARGYLHSDVLRWSYGAVEGRPEDTAVATQALAPGALVDVALAAGFEGIWLDRNGAGSGGSADEAGLRAVVEGEPLVSSDARFVFFSLQQERRRFEREVPAATRAELRRRFLAPITLGRGRGFHEPEADFQRHWVWMPSSAALVLHNPSDGKRRARVTAEVETAHGGSAVLRIGGAGGSRVGVPGTGETVSFEVVLESGRNLVRLTTDVPRQHGPDGRDLRLRLIDLRVVDAVLAEAGGAAS
jgi:hypothetical protein